MTVAPTLNYGWPRPDRDGIQRQEIDQIATALGQVDTELHRVDVGLAALLASFSTHSHSFAQIAGKPTTVAGYGITDAYTKTEADAAIAQARASLKGEILGGADPAFDTLQELQKAIGNDANVAATLTAAIATKANASQVLRNDADSTLSARIVVAGTMRNGGIVGTYDATKTQQIWSIGLPYLSAADGSNFGSLYGLAYKHTTNPTGGNMAGGHQVVWCNNGVGYSAMGDGGLWTSGEITGLSDRRVKTNLRRIEGALQKVLAIGGFLCDRTDTGRKDEAVVIAQELLAAGMTGLVTGSDEELYSVAYPKMAAYFVEAFRDVAALIADQAAALAKQAAEIAALNARLEA